MKAKDTQKLTRQTPHNLEAEQSVLGCILFDSQNENVVENFSRLNSSMFYSESNRLIFEGMQNIYKKGTVVDLVTVTDELEKSGNLSAVGGMEYLVEISQKVISLANFQYHLDIVIRDANLRGLIDAATNIIKKSSSDTTDKDALSYAQQKIMELSDTRARVDFQDVSIRMPDVIQRFTELDENPEVASGLKVGLDNVDNWFNGFNKGNLIIVAARPSVGKTSLAMNFVENAALAGNVCAVFCLEMTTMELMQRMLCSVSKVSAQKAIRGELGAVEWRRLVNAQKEFENTKIFLDESSMVTVPDMLNKCRRLKIKEGRLDMVMVDYIQLMDTPDKAENRQQQVAEISRGLKNLARELDVPVVALSQLKRLDGNANRKPTLSDLRESGAIEQDADIVMFIHRPDMSSESKIDDGAVEKNIVELIVEKNRNGGIGTIKLRWIPEYTKFVNYTDKKIEQQAEAYLAGMKKKQEASETADEPNDIPLPTEPPQETEDLPFDV